MIAYETGVGQVTGVFPATAAKNSSTTGGTDGTPLVAAVYNNIWGFFQALMNSASLTPNGVEESYSASQLLTALHDVIGGKAGDLWLSLIQSPATVGIRALILTGQVISIASYANLVTNTYVGDANNGNTAYQYFYKCSDSGGSTRSTSGTYYKLPDFRGVFLRGLDIGATRNPNGTSDVLGNFRTFAMQYHGHDGNGSGDTAGTAYPTITGNAAGRSFNSSVIDPITLSGHTTLSADEETRPMQGIIQIGIRY